MCQGLLQVSLEPIGIDSDHDAEEGQEGQIDLGGLSWILILLSERTNGHNWNVQRTFNERLTIETERQQVSDAK